jgi:hypothetical protein
LAGDYYEIRVEGHLDSSWEGSFGGVAIHHEPSGETVLSGMIEDQAALHGMLALVRDLNLKLIAVTKR